VSRRHLLACGRCKIRQPAGYPGFFIYFNFENSLFMKLKDYIYFEVFIFNFFRYISIAFL
jgi:hypothetical protein